MSEEERGRGLSEEVVGGEGFESIIMSRAAKPIRNFVPAFRKNQSKTLREAINDRRRNPF